MIGQALHCISSRLKERFKRDVLRSLVNCPKRRRSSGRINPFQTNKLVSFNIPPRPAPLCISDHVIFALEVWPCVADSAKFERNSSLGCHHMICGKTNVQAKKSQRCHGRIFAWKIYLRIIWLVFGHWIIYSTERTMIYLEQCIQLPEKAPKFYQKITHWILNNTKCSHLSKPKLYIVYFFTLFKYQVT